MKRIIIGVIVCIYAITMMAWVQAHDVKGVVFDKKQQPIAGTLITAKRTNINTITGVNSKFFLQGIPLSVKKVIVTPISMGTREVNLNVPVQLTGRRKRLSFVTHAGISMNKCTTYGSDFKVEYELGLGIRVRMSKQWAFRPTLQIYNRGAEFNAEGNGVKYQETWNPVSLGLPVLLILRYPVTRKMNLAFSVGPVFPYDFAGKIEAMETGKPGEEYDIYSKRYEYSYYGGKYSLLHPFGLGVAYGIDAGYKKWLIGASGKGMCLGQDNKGLEAKKHNLAPTLGVTHHF